MAYHNWILEKEKTNRHNMKPLEQIIKEHIEFLQEQIADTQSNYPYECDKANGSAETATFLLGMEVKFLEKVMARLTNNETPA